MDSINPINPDYDQDDLHYDSKAQAHSQSTKGSDASSLSCVNYSSNHGAVMGYLDRDYQIVHKVDETDRRMIIDGQ